MPRAPRTSPRLVEALQAALDAEMDGVALYVHLSCRVFGPRIEEIVTFLRAQAAESLLHAQNLGDRMTDVGAVPRIRMREAPGSEPRTLDEVLRVALVHERRAVELYREVMENAGDDIAMEEFARGMVAAESAHATHMEKMLRTME
jgi:bacterioferritin